MTGSIARHVRMLDRTAADIQWEWLNKAAVAAMRRSEAADASALETIKEMEDSRADHQ